MEKRNMAAGIPEQGSAKEALDEQFLLTDGDLFSLLNLQADEPLATVTTLFDDAGGEVAAESSSEVGEANHENSDDENDLKFDAERVQHFFGRVTKFLGY